MKDKNMEKQIKQVCDDATPQLGGKLDPQYSWERITTCNCCPKPQTKNDPIRWDFSQKEIEKMMNLLAHSRDVIRQHYGECSLVECLESVKDDWQRKIDWNIDNNRWH